MAVSTGGIQNVQIAITLEESFMNAIPDYFQLGSDMKLHHDHRKVNVFAHKKLTGKNLFADSFGEVLEFESAEELNNIKHRLLTNPIFLQVRLEKELKSGNTRYITRGSFIVYINTQHPNIRHQLEGKLTQMQGIVYVGGHAALEINFEKVLKQWFKANFQETWASYSTDNSNFCITNYSQRTHACYNPLYWLVCLPCCLLGAPCYCIHRKMNCVDLDCSISAMVQYTAGVNEEERQELLCMLARAYTEGLNDANQIIGREPARMPPIQPQPPPYSSVPQSQVPKMI